MDDFRLQEARELAAMLDIDPVYFLSSTSAFVELSDEGRALIFSNDSTIAFTSPIADLMFQKALRYEWNGRGCAIAFRKSPLTMTASEVLGVVVHELGHHVAECDNPARDDPNFDRAIKAGWASMKTEEQAHGHRWLRATVHLWHRACIAGYTIPFSETVNLEQYGYGRKDLAPLLDEASRREHEPVETILRSTPRLRTQNSAGKRTKRTKPRLSNNIAMICGEPVRTHSNGTVETFARADGSQAGKRHRSFSEFMKSKTGW